MLRLAAARRGRQPRDVAKRLGHSLAVLLSTYAHLIVAQPLRGTATGIRSQPLGSEGTGFTCNAVDSSLDGSRCRGAQNRPRSGRLWRDWGATGARVLVILAAPF